MMAEEAEDKAELALEMFLSLLGAHTALVGLLAELALERQVPKELIKDAMQRLDAHLDAAVPSERGRKLITRHLVAVYRGLLGDE